MSAWRSLLGCHELCCDGTEKATTPAGDSETVPPRASAIPLDRVSASLPPDQISQRIAPNENTARVTSSQPRDDPVSMPPDQAPQSIEPTENTVLISSPHTPDEPDAQSAINPQDGPVDSSGSGSYDALRKQQQELQELWKEAIDKFEAFPDGVKLSALLQAQRQINTGESTMGLSELLANLEGQMKRVGLRGKIADNVGKVVPHINRIAIVGDVAVSANPMPAALPWAAVRFILLGITAGEDIRAKIVEGIAEIVILIFECSVYQQLYLTAEDTKSLSTSQRLREIIIDTLSQCIRLLAFALRRQQAVAKALTDAFRLEDFSGYLKDLHSAKLQLHAAGSLCEMYHRSQDRELLKDLHNLIDDLRKGSIQLLEHQAKPKLKDLLLSPGDAVDHVDHPVDSFCLQGTRQNVLRDIYDWAEDTESRTICWLPGLAGTGKSTISRTVARDLKGRCLGGSFFFKKGAGNRAGGRTIFSIIAYQLALNFPPVRQHIIDAVQEDPSSVMRSMNEQWRILIREPLNKVHDKEFIRTVVLVVDALDECDADDRRNMMALLTECPDVLKVFITSRPEFDIEAHFARHQQLHREIALHRVKMVDIKTDITIFLKHRIRKFLLDHNSCHMNKALQLDANWPGSERFQALVMRSVPLFIAAATFIRLIENIYWAGSPDSKLDSIIDDSNQVRSAYDATYTPVLDLILNGAPAEARVKAHDSFTRIVGSLILLANPLSMVSLSVLLDVEIHDVAGVVDPLRSVLDVPRDDGPIKLFHLSFRDFLLSKSAGGLEVDEASTHAKLASRCLRHLERALKTDICGLGSPGRSRFDIDQDTINRKIPQQTQYACLYWVHHLIGSGKQLQDDDEEHQFLKRFFLNWIEVLCLTGQFFESPNMLQQLLKIVNKKSGNVIFKFVQDAIRFIHFFRYGIEETPLQLYHSGILFSPSSSIAPQPFENRCYPKSVMRLPAADSDWPQNVQTFEVGGRYGKKELVFLSNKIITTWGVAVDVKIWDISSGSCLKTLKYWKDIRSSDGPSTVPAIGWFLEGSLLAIGAKGRIDIWNFNSHSLIHCLPLEGRLISGVAFSNDGMSLCSISKVATESRSEPVFFIHDLDSGKCTSRVPIRNGYDFVCLSTKGQWISCLADKVIWLSAWDPSNVLDWVNLGFRDRYSFIRFSSDGSLLAVTSNNGYFRIWRTATKQCIWTLQHPYKVPIGGLSLTKNLLAVSSFSSPTVIFDLKTGTISHEMGKNSRGCLAISTDAKLLATDSESNIIRVWNLSPQQSIPVGMFHPHEVKFLTLTSDGSTVVSACTNQVKTWDASSGICIETLGESNTMTFRTATEDGSYCVMSSGRNVEVWSRNPWRVFKSLQREEEQPNPNSGPWAISENGELLALPIFYNGKRKTEIWDVYRGLLRQALNFSPLTGSKTVFSPDGSLIAYTTDYFIEIGQISELCKLLTRIEDVHTLKLTSLSFHGQKLVGTSVTGEITSWDIKTGNVINSCQTGIGFLGKHFINYEVLLGHVGPDVHLRQNVLKELQVSSDESWIMRRGEKLLWLPPDYRPHDQHNSQALTAYASGSTIVIGTRLGRVFNLCMAD